MKIFIIPCNDKNYCTLKKKSLEYVADSDKETIKLGQKLGALLADGDVVALVGELGSGKTWFTKGLALGLGVNPHTVITSPSFAFVNEYQGRYTFFHMDLYRLESLAEFISAGLEEYLYNNGSVVAMEWGDRWPEILPEQSIKVEFVIIDENFRKITLSGHHPRTIKIIESINKDLVSPT
ncbi:MAG: tRNA (adenosine(37)-N6)-threonylcarbamoyltransferase complex ATPase subunit type 1 TsaE [Desulfatiglandaceae bacterium]